MLDASSDVINVKIETDDYYFIRTNNHIENVPNNRVKCIITFVSDDNKEDEKLNQLKNWLIDNKYPDHVIAKTFQDIKLKRQSLS